MRCAHRGALPGALPGPLLFDLADNNEDAVESAPLGERSDSVTGVTRVLGVSGFVDTTGMHCSAQSGA